MSIAWLYRKVKYLLLNPRYFIFYFYGKPEKVISSLTGDPEDRFFELKNELESKTHFFQDLRARTQRFTNEDFDFNIDHYFLYSLVRMTRPSVILETGVFHGYYTACFLQGIYDNYKEASVDGKVISIDLPAYQSISESTSETGRTRLPSGCDPGWVIPEYLRDRWELYVGDSRDLLPDVLSKEKNISLFFHDSLHTYSHMMYEFEAVFPVLNKGAYLMSHDIHWNRAFRNFVKKYNQRDYAVHGFGIIRKE